LAFAKKCIKLLRKDLPEPESPVPTTTNLFLGMVRFKVLEVIYRAFLNDDVFSWDPSGIDVDFGRG